MAANTEKAKKSDTRSRSKTSQKTKSELESLRQNVKTLNDSRRALEAKASMLEKALHLFSQPHKLEDNVELVMDIALEVTDTSAGAILLIWRQNSASLAL